MVQVECTSAGETLPTLVEVFVPFNPSLLLLWLSEGPTPVSQTSHVPAVCSGAVQASLLRWLLCFMLGIDENRRGGP